MTVKRRITLLVAGAGFLASLLFSLAVFFELVEQPFQILDEELAEEAKRAAQVVAARQGAAERLHNHPVTGEFKGLWITVVDRESGNVVYRSPLAESFDLAQIAPGTAETVGVNLPAGSTSPERDRRRETTLRVKAFAFYIDGYLFVVQIACPMNKLCEEIWELVFSLVAGLILSGLVLIAISHLVASKILQPIATMKALTRDISEKKF